MNLSKDTQLKLVLAPMAGFTNKAMREICQELGADITWSEMISAEGIFRNESGVEKSLQLAQQFSSREKNYWVQIFGNNPHTMSVSAKIITDKIKPLGIDINLGCPVKKAQKSGYGAIQIGEVDNVVEIIKAIKGNTSLPLSLKTRLGLKNADEILTFAPKLEKAGLDQLVVHARTLPGMFHSQPDWEIIVKLKNILNIPIIYNGGIKTPQDAKFYFDKTGCDTLMIGQASIGNPWIFKQIKDFFNSEKFEIPTIKERKDIILKHAGLIKKYYGEKSFVPFRPQLAAYLKGLPNSSELRSKAVQIKNLKDIKNILTSIK